MNTILAWTLVVIGVIGWVAAISFGMLYYSTNKMLDSAISMLANYLSEEKGRLQRQIRRGWTDH